VEEYPVSSNPSENDFMLFSAHISKDICIKKSINTLCVTIVSAIIIYLFATILPEIPSNLRAEYLNPLGKSGIFALIFILFLIIYTILGKVLKKYNKIELTAPNGNLCRPKKNTISKDGITETNEYHTSHTKWGGITKIEETNDLIIFYVDSYSGYYIPKKAFDNNEDSKNFFKRAEAFYQEAHNKNPWTKTPIESNPEQKDVQ
jgi:hypothetical protein